MVNSNTKTTSTPDTLEIMKKYEINATPELYLFRKGETELLKNS